MTAVQVRRDTGCVWLRNPQTGTQFSISDQQAVALQAALSRALRSAPSDVDHMVDAAALESRSGYRIGER